MITPTAEQGLPHLREKLDALSKTCSVGRGGPKADFEQQVGDAIAAIEYVAWCLRLDWNAIDERSAAESLRLQREGIK